MKNTMILASFLALAPLAKGQLLLEALDAPETTILPTLPNGITISEGKHFIVSIYDTDYLPYTMPTSSAVWSTVAADNIPEEKVIDYQGTIPAEGIKIQIPITATGNVVLPTFTSSEIAIDPQGEEGIANSTRKVILSWEQQNITSATKFITATIKPANNQVLNVKKLDLNGGLGNDYKGTLLAHFSLPKSNQNTTEKVGYELRVISGIPDRKFGIATNGKQLHNFLYTPIEVTGANGYRKTWLNNNLGAEYADVNNPRGNFNLTKQATAYNDYLAYGSLYQWQRPSDGHELVTWTSGTSGTRSRQTSTLSNNSNWTAGHSNFIRNSSNSYSWVNNSINESSSNKNLWQANGANNPCPVGYHVPTKAEWEELHAALGGSNNYTHWANSALRLPAAGWRHDYVGVLSYQSRDGNYWSSAAGNSTFSWRLNFDSSGSGTYNNARALGFSVRCLKD